jgi:uncharacterized protein (DUF362 family)
MHRRHFLKSLALAPAAGLVGIPCWLTTKALAQQQGGVPQPNPFKPSEGVNIPMGVGRGIHPGRVAWSRDANATSWDGATGHWWEDAYTDQKTVDRMTSRVLQSLTGRNSDKQAWDALFRNFNETRKLGGSGYRAGEKIAIKINCNQDRSPEWGTSAPAGPAGGPPRKPLDGLPSPHAVLALVTQLINVAGVPGEDITLYEVADRRNIGQPIFGRIRANSARDFQAVKFVVNNDYKMGGRIMPTPDKANPVQFSKVGVPVAYLPEQVTGAKYMINMALLRPHGMAGVTLTGKNHFGSIYFPDNGGWTPRPLHDYVQRALPMGSYNVLVDLLGHQHLGAKTMLYMLDGLYSAEHNEANVYRFASFADDWASSLLASQDPIALDSVGLDLLSSEPRATQVQGNADNYLHEAAQAGKAPSGTVYAPDKSGAPLSSLGVHEHWNNAKDRKYSRNLGRKQGIELIVSA